MQLVDLQTSRDAPQYCYALVVREVVSRVGSQQLENISQRCFVLVFLTDNGRRFRFRRQHDAARVAPDFNQLARYLSDGEHEVDETAVNRMARHRIVFGFIRILCECQSVMLLDALQSVSAIRTHPREHNADRILFMSFAERPKETIDGDLLSSAQTSWLFNDDLPVAHLEVFCRWDYIDMIRFDLDGFSHLRDRHLGSGLQKRGGVTFMFRG